MQFLLFQAYTCEFPKSHLAACVEVTADVVRACSLATRLSTHRYLRQYKGMHRGSAVDSRVLISRTD